MASISLTVEFDIDQIRSELQTAADRALEIIGGKAETYAKLLCPVDTGNLRDSIWHRVNDMTVSVGTPTDYAPYVELGTGPYFSMPPAWIEFHAQRGRGLPRWVYRDRDGNFRTGYPQRPRPFIRPALENHTDEYRGIVETTLQQGG